MNRILFITSVLFSLLFASSCKEKEEDYKILEDIITPKIFYGEDNKYNEIVKWKSKNTTIYTYVKDLTNGIILEEDSRSDKKIKTVAFSDKEMEHTYTTGNKEEVISYLVTNNDQLSLETSKYHPGVHFIETDVEYEAYTQKNLTELLDILNNDISGYEHFVENSFLQDEKDMINSWVKSGLINFETLRLTTEIITQKNQKEYKTVKNHYLYRIVRPHNVKELLEDL